jgi:drug/metabolite transporter (DMT)-like permease
VTSFTEALERGERAYAGRSPVVDAMLAGTVVLWALNITVTKYLISHGWAPLAYGTIRYGLAIVLFAAYTYLRERSFAIERRDVKRVLLAGGLIFCNQLCFVYGLKLTDASTVGLVLGAVPIFIGAISAALGIERLGRAFWVGACVTVVGVAFVALSSGQVDSSATGVLLAIALALTWGAYSVAIAPMMRRYSPFRISSLVLATGWLPLALVGAHEVAAQHFSFGWLAWLGFGYAVVGPLFLTNVLWFTAMDRVGPSRAALFANFEPFLAVVFAVVLLSEDLYALEIAGGVLILVGIALERVWHQSTVGATSALD